MNQRKLGVFAVASQNERQQGIRVECSIFGSKNVVQSQ